VSPSVGVQSAADMPVFKWFSGRSGGNIDALQGFFTDHPPMDIVLRDVTYNLTGITASTTSSIVADTVTEQNDTSVANSFTFTSSYSVSQTYNFSITKGWKFTIGEKLGFKGNILEGVSGSWEVSSTLELNGEIQNGKATTVSTTRTLAVPVALPAFTAVTADVLVVRATIPSVAWTGALFVSYADGTSETLPVSGTFTGVTAGEAKIRLTEKKLR